MRAALNPSMQARSSGSLPSRSRDIGFAAAIVMGTVVAYLPALGGQLLWDDDWYVTRRTLQSLHGLWRIWAEPGATEQYYPLLHSIFWIQHRVFGDNPMGYHAFTLLLHVAASILLGCVLRRLAVPGAWLAAMVFALHPVHVESVAWISEQKNTLSLVCFLASALAYFRFDETRRTSDYAAALTWFVLSLLIKTVTVTLPAALLVVLWWKRGRLHARRDVRPLLPWLVLGAAAGLFSSWVERRFLGAEGQAFELPFADRILVAGRAVWFYLGHLVWPLNLNFIYTRWRPDSASLRQWMFPLAAFALGGLLWSIRKRARAPLAAYLIFVGTLFPVLGFVNLYGALFSFVWDHWQYLPDIAPIALGTAALALAGNRLAPALQGARPYMAGALGLALGSMTWIHCGVFHDPETLYTTTLARNPYCWMAENNLAITLKQSGRLAESIGHYQNALRMEPNRPEIIRNNLGIALAGVGRFPEAVQQYDAALKIKPEYVDAESNLAIALAKSGRVPEAIAHFEAALRLSPDRADIRGFLARALLVSGNVDGAIEQYEIGLSLKPEHPESVHYDMGMALSQSGRLPEAIEQFEEAVHIDPNYAEAQNDLGIALANSGRVAEALACFQTVSRLRPDVADAHSNLAEALQALGRNDEAAAEFRKAGQLSRSAPGH
jgi:protein O-mannosyl-transferase